MICASWTLARRAAISSVFVVKMPTADATLLPPLPELPEDPGSGRSLDAVGPLAVLGAMVEQKKRASRPAPEEIHGVVEDPDDGDADATQPRRVPQHSDAFLKAR